MWCAPTLAVNVKAQLALWVLGAKIDLAGGGINSFGYQDKMVDEFLHLGEDLDLWWQGLFGIHIVDWPGGKFLGHLFQNLNALSHFLHPDEVAIE